MISSLKKKLSLRWLEGRFLRGAKTLHALCPEEKCDLRAHGFDNVIEVIPNGLNDEEFSRFDAACDRDADPYDHDFVNIVLVARLRPDKNVIGMIRMLDYLPPEIRKKIRIHLVGDGVEPYLSMIRNAAKKHPDNVIFHGPKYDEEKYAFICKADIYVQPSFCEGVSFSILDAMAAGKAMILSRQTNMTHYYNRNFYRMTETYPEDIAAAVAELAKDRELMVKLGRNAQTVARSIFSWKNLIGDYAKMYERALMRK